jgi:hypothetical protein
MQEYYHVRAHRPRPTHFPTTFANFAPRPTASFAKPPYPGLTQAQLREIVLDQLG